MKDNKAVSNFMDPFMDDEDDVRRIAQQMEAKYVIDDIIFLLKILTLWVPKWFLEN